MRKITKIVLTGGPCGGKSEIIKRLKEHFEDRVIIVEEVATQLLQVPFEDGGPGIPGKDLEWSQDWQDNFQKMVIERQMESELFARKLAEASEIIEMIICDRGILDGAAYIEGGVECFLAQFGLNETECHELYDQIIHLSSLATDQPAEYNRLKETNPNRFESTEEAAQLDQKILLAWRGHPRHSFLKSTGHIDLKIEQCLELIRPSINDEVEIKNESDKASAVELQQITSQPSC
ncbi:MAG: ATP-binding protein [bacterium]